MDIFDILFKDPKLFFIYIFAIFYAISIHEFAHAFFAYKAGDFSQISQDRLTLNPLKHIDFFGFITLLFFGIGWGRPVLIDYNNFKEKNKKFYTFMVSFGGILFNFLSACFFALCLKILSGFSFYNSTNLLIIFLIILININIVIAVFNLIPIPPLDGSKILFLFLPKSMNGLKIFLLTKGSYILFGLLFVSILTDFSIFSFLYNPVISFIYNLFSII
ncbi:site-2 protease family protein [bacterium]|nr:site-2 protease family protein [bacterium]